MDNEEVRIAAHPGISFKEGPSGRRAALAQGPDIWEVVTVVNEIDRPGASAESAIREVLNLTATQIETALRYYAAHPDDINGESATRDAESRAAEQEWRAHHPSPRLT